jgi:hypothetical protein
MLEGEPVLIQLSNDGLGYHCTFDAVVERSGGARELRGIEQIVGPEEALANHARFIEQAERLFKTTISVPQPKILVSKQDMGN